MVSTLYSNDMTTQTDKKSAERQAQVAAKAKRHELKIRKAYRKLGTTERRVRPVVDRMARRYGLSGSTKKKVEGLLRDVLAEIGGG